MTSDKIMNRRQKIAQHILISDAYVIELEHFIDRLG